MYDDTTHIGHSQGIDPRSAVSIGSRNFRWCKRFLAISPRYLLGKNDVAKPLTLTRNAMYYSGVRDVDHCETG